MGDPRVVPMDSVPGVPRKSPVTTILESLPEGYMTTREVAEKFDVHVETIRRLIKATKADGTPRVNAPTDKAVVGGLQIYLFTAEDVEELEEYFRSRVRTHKKG